MMRSYEHIIDEARYGKREPNEEDAAAAEKCVEVVTRAWVIICLEERSTEGTSRMGARVDKVESEG
jgi:hypothetical protein